jgi:pre-mRNA-splicing factor SYF1
LKVDAIIRGGIQRYTDQLGHLWNSLADYYVRSGLFERVSLLSVFPCGNIVCILLTSNFDVSQARDIYEEAIESVTTVRDFTQIFDAYSQFEELSLSKKMEEVNDNPNATEEGIVCA